MQHLLIPLLHVRDVQGALASVANACRKIYDSIVLLVNIFGTWQHSLCRRRSVFPPVTRCHSSGATWASQSWPPVLEKNVHRFLWEMETESIYNLILVEQKCDVLNCKNSFFTELWNKSLFHGIIKTFLKFCKWQIKAVFTAIKQARND